MIAVIFEVWPATGRSQNYLDFAAALRAELDHVEGFISVERFKSLSEPGKLLSLSVFRDEEAVMAWRNLPCHRRAQDAGRGGVLRDYRLRVATVIRDYGRDSRLQAPLDSRTAHQRAVCG